MVCRGPRAFGDPALCDTKLLNFPVIEKTGTYRKDESLWKRQAITKKTSSYARPTVMKKMGGYLLKPFSVILIEILNILS